MIAYFDAGTGSMLLSAVAAGFAGVAIAGKSVWYKIAFWRKTEESNLNQAVDVEGDGTDGLELGEIDDAELDIT